MRKRTWGVLFGVLLVLMASVLGCSVSQLVARQSSVTATPTRTPHPTWTPQPGSIRVATPTLDRTRFPGVVLPTEAPPTAQVWVPGGSEPIFVPLPANGASGVQTVVVIIVTATPLPVPTPTPGPYVPPTKPPPSATPGPPTGTPTVTPTPIPPVVVRVKEDQANVRQGPGVSYPLVTQLSAGTTVTVVGRNRAGDWWKICCVNGADVWIANDLVDVEGPIWLVAEVTNIPPSPTPAPTAGATATVTPTPTYAWAFRLESREEFPLGQDLFRVEAVIYNGATPLWGYRLRVTRWSTGQSWLSEGSMSANWNWTVVAYPTDGGLPVNPNIDCRSATRTGLQCRKNNVKWDTNVANTNMGDDIWEVVVADGAGNPLSAPVRFYTSVANSKWYYLVFTSR